MKPTAPLAHTLRVAQYLLAGGVLVATLVLAVIVYLVAKTALRPIGRMARDAAGIQQAQDLSRRVEERAQGRAKRRKATRR